MLPGAFSVIAVIACIILVTSGWGSHIIHSSNIKRSYLVFLMLSYLLFSPFSISGFIVQSITMSGAVLPSILAVVSMMTLKGWKHKILFLLKGVSIGSAAAGAVICLNQLFVIHTERLYWLSAVLITLSSFTVYRSFLNRWCTALLAVETASVWIDVCVSYVPTEHLVIGSSTSQDMLVAVSIGVWLMTSIVNEVKHIWKTGQVAMLHSRMKRT